MHRSYVYNRARLVHSAPRVPHHSQTHLERTPRAIRTQSPEQWFYDERSGPVTKRARNHVAGFGFEVGADTQTREADGTRESESALPSQLPDTAAVICRQLWEQLQQACEERERNTFRKEAELRNFEIQVDKEKELIDSLKREVVMMRGDSASLRDEVRQERACLQMELQQLRKEKEAMEHLSTDIAVQLAEVKQAQRQVEKERASLNVVKIELQEMKNVLDERENALLKLQIQDSPTDLSRLGSRETATTSQSEDEQKHLGGMAAILAKDKCASSCLPQSGRTFSVKAEAEDICICDVTCEAPFLVSEQDVVSGVENNSSVGNNVKVSSDRNREAAFLQQSCEQLEEKVSPPAASDGDDKQKDRVAIEAALEEDAPGLLATLRERGLLDGLQIFGSNVLEEELNDSDYCNFTDLESVVGKLWKRVGVLSSPTKQQSVAGSNVPKYCLSCLISLIEQTQSVRRRSWPVEWGWCRRLYSFIFVFEKHNRIILERPEYGYATYFFEIEHGLPVKWQLQRLIAVMCVVTKGRAALLENRSLEVGQDLSEDEAATLVAYGWTPNSGLGSLLNFCDRVVHDCKDSDNRDWRIKLGKCLMNGHDHGSLVKILPHNLSGCSPAGVQESKGPEMLR